MKSGCDREFCLVYPVNDRFLRVRFFDRPRDLVQAILDLGCSPFRESPVRDLRPYVVLRRGRPVRIVRKAPHTKHLPGDPAS